MSHYDLPLSISVDSAVDCAGTLITSDSAKTVSLNNLNSKFKNLKSTFPHLLPHVPRFIGNFIEVRKLSCVV